MPSPLTHVKIFQQQWQPLKQLSGYRKGSKLPDSVSASSNKFVASMAEDEINEDMQEALDLLRANFKFKRRELEIDGPSDGAGSITTPYFTYQIGIGLDPERITHACWTRELNHIHDPQKLITDAFDECFGAANWILEMPVKDPMDIADVIDNIEDAENDAIEINYDKDATWCDVNIQGVLGTLRVTPSAFVISPPSSIPPRKIFETLFQMRVRLAEIQDFDQFQ